VPSSVEEFCGGKCDDIFANSLVASIIERSKPQGRS